jgi:ring-1,2-phenylacetyl-CoA epoxidase subunit PaaD
VVNVAAARIASAWAVLDGVLDPEVPVVSVRDLGIVRDVQAHRDGIEVTLTPTYSGCPATEFIEQGVREALEAAGLGPVTVQMRRAPAWTSDWISAEGRRKLLAYGIVPPCTVAEASGSQAPAGPVAVPMRFVPRPVVRLACPRCASTNTERLAAFGSTACKALHRCLACGDPFEHFKPI